MLPDDTKPHRRFSARRIVSAQKDYELADGDTIEEVRTALDKLRHVETPDGSAWPGTFRIYEQRPGSLDAVVGEIDVDADGVRFMRKVRG